MLKKLTLALTLTAATASAEVTLEDQDQLTVLMAVIAVREFCDFDLTAEAKAFIDGHFAYMGSKYSEAVNLAAIGVSAELIRERRNAAASVEAWCAEKLSLGGPLVWSEPN